MKNVLLKTILTAVLTITVCLFCNTSYSGFINPEYLRNNYKEDFSLNIDQKEAVKKVIQKRCGGKYVPYLSWDSSSRSYIDKCNGKEILVKENGTILFGNKKIGRWK